ncbi:MAG: hypothetical protein EA379_12690, partial [Phycisphaerales bacterium]
MCAARVALLAGAAAAAISLTAPALSAQDDPPRQAFPAFEPVSLDGRTFADIVFDDAPRASPMRFVGQRAWSWHEGSTRRLLLDRDVRVHIGGRRFIAERAVVWMESFDPERPRKRQVAVYFLNVRDPDGPADIAVTADRLLVTGVIEGDIELATDRLEHARPVNRFLDRAEARLAEYLLDLVAPAPPTATKPPPPPFRHAITPEPTPPPVATAPDDAPPPCL